MPDEDASPELVELVDANGVPSGVVIQRWDAETRRDLYVPVAVAVILTSDDRVVVHRRSATRRTSPGRIDHAGGVVPAGEDPLTAVIREAEEEVGLTVTPGLVQGRAAPGDRRNLYFWVYGGISDDNPGANCPNDEVESVWHASMTELQDLQANDEATFTTHFWPDLNAVLDHGAGLDS